MFGFELERSAPFLIRLCFAETTSFLFRQKASEI